MTCRKRKTRCAGERPICSTCSKNGHVCLGYTDASEKKKEDRGNGGSVLAKADGAGTAGSSDGAEEEPENRRRKPGVVPRTAGFVDHDAWLRRDSTPSTAVKSGRPPESSSDWDQDDKSQGSVPTARRPNYARNVSYSEGSRNSNNRTPVQHHTESHRMPYFRYFGPTAIVPGYKRMVVDVPRSRGSSFSTTASPGSFFGYGLSQQHPSYAETFSDTLGDLPVYDVDSPDPVHPFLISLVDTFFHNLGCNYPFLRKDRFLRMLKEKRAEPYLVDAVCALAARFSDHPIFTKDRDGKMQRSEYGHVFAQRAKAATVDTFPCPSVSAIQASLLMAYERFGADQDSALWMYLGIAIRMAVDLGLQKMEGIKCQGQRDSWYSRGQSQQSNGESDGPDSKRNDEETLSPEEQRELEQERIDTFWAVFVLDRAISSGTGRPVTIRDGDWDLPLPAPTIDPVSGWPAPFPALIEIIHLYGRVSDVLNNIRDANDLTEEKMAKLAQMERDLTEIYKKQDPRLHFNAVNFREYVNANQGATFILLHFWFHALIIILHQPTLLTPFHNMKPTQLLPNSRELSMSSAKTIADILAFAELIDLKSFIGNPFTSQPIYIAACAFLMESVANSSASPSRETTPSFNAKGENGKPSVGKDGSNNDVRSTKHSILASAANQNYQRCYTSLTQLKQYWGGVRYILTALDQKSKGIWDCETFTSEEYEAIKQSRGGSFGRLPKFDHPSSPSIPPIAYSLTGTTNSPNSNLTVLFQSNLPTHSSTSASAALTPLPPSTPAIPVSAATPPGNMVYDPIRQSLPEAPPTFAPAYLQHNVSAVRHQPHAQRITRLSPSPSIGKATLKYETSQQTDVGSSSPHESKPHLHQVIPRSGHGPLHHSPYIPSPRDHSAYDAMVHQGTTNRAPADSGMGRQHALHNQHNHNHTHAQVHTHSHSHSHSHSHAQAPAHSSNSVDHNNSHGYGTDFTQSGLVSGSYPSYLGPNPSANANPAAINDSFTFNSQEVNFDMLGLQSEMMPPWLEMILPGDVLDGMFEGGMMGGANQGGHMG